MLVTHSSTAKQEEKQGERGSCQTLPAIGIIACSIKCPTNVIGVNYK